MEQVTTQEIDLAKNVFALHGVDGAEKTGTDLINLTEK